MIELDSIHTALIAMDSVQNYLLYGATFIFYMLTMLLILNIIIPIREFREALKGDDGVLQWAEFIELMKVVIMIVSFCTFVTKLTVDTIAKNDKNIVIYIILALIFSGSVYAMDKNKLLDFFNRK